MENISKQLICVNECLHKQVKLVSNPRTLYVVKLVIIRYFCELEHEIYFTIFRLQARADFFPLFFPLFFRD